MEILVVDDGSTDATPAIVKRFAPRVTYIRKENGGQASAFNLGIPQARGEIIAFLDGDDWWQPNKLSQIVEAMEKNPQAGVIGHGIFQIESATGSGSALTPQEPGYFDLRSDEGARKFRNFMCFLGTSRVAIRRNLLEKVLPIPEMLVVEADEFMSAVAIAHGGAYLLAEPLTYYRLHDQNQYQFRGGDTSRMRRKMNSLASLARELPPRLVAAGVQASAVKIIIEPHPYRRGPDEIDSRWWNALGNISHRARGLSAGVQKDHRRLPSMEGIRAGGYAMHAAALVLPSSRLVCRAKSAALPRGRRRTRACCADSRRAHRAPRRMNNCA